MKKTFVALVACAGILAAAGSAQAGGAGCLKNTTASTQGTSAPQVPAETPSGSAG